jgi:hypothetical protein
MRKHSIFRNIISILVIMHLIGCTTLHPIEIGPDELHYKIRHDNIVNIHDWVRVITEDEKEYRFQVTEINEKVIRGDDIVNNVVVSVPIDSIVALETQEISIGKTSLLVGSYFLIGLIIAIFFGAALIGMP